MPQRARRNRNKQLPRLSGAMRAILHGHRLRIPPDPPSYVATPWNSLVVDIGSTGDLKVLGKNICSTLIVQAGLPSTATIDIRVLKVRVWCTVVKRPIRVEFFGFSNTAEPSGGAIASIEDWPGANSFAAIGYQFPVALQSIVLSSDSTTKVFTVDVGSSYGWIAYVDVLWKGNQLTPVTFQDRCRARMGMTGEEDFVPL